MDLNVENVDFECEDISEQEKKELENFESSGKLLQEIENTLMKQISAFFIDEHKKSDEHVKKYEGNEVVIQKGPTNLGANCSIEGRNYFIRFKFKTLDEADAQFLMKAYNIQQILECTRWDGRLYTNVPYSVFIFKN
jgi:hypothetical protein